MQSVKAFILLFIVAVLLFPWPLICLTHPAGHDYAHHDGPSPCEMRKSLKDGDAILPPMHCKSVVLETNEWWQTKQEPPVKPGAQTLVFVAVLSGLIDFDLPEVEHIILPEQSSNSDPPIEAVSLRGPPMFNS